MGKANLQRRIELASTLLYEFKNIYVQIENASTEVEKTSGAFYEEAFKENQEELRSVMESYHKNVDRTRQIYDEITATINSWYAFIKGEKEIEKITFPIVYSYKKRSLSKKIASLNAEISSITINNRFIKENLAILEHKLEIEAESLLKSGGNYTEYEKILMKKKSLSAELIYLLPTIPGLCPADISAAGIDKTLSLIH